MLERYYAATFTEDEINMLINTLGQVCLFEEQPAIDRLLAYLEDVKYETNYNLKEEQYEN